MIEVRAERLIEALRTLRAARGRTVPKRVWRLALDLAWAVRQRRAYGRAYFQRYRRHGPKRRGQRDELAAMIAAVLRVER